MCDCYNQIQRVLLATCIRNKASPAFSRLSVSVFCMFEVHSSFQVEQVTGLTMKGRKAWSHDKALPRPRPNSRSYHRPNSTHTYLTKTLTVDGTHDGFNPKHGTPTRAQ